jgi:hypothetical protein
MCEQCRVREDADRIMWLAIRRGLLALVRAIETRYGDARNEKRAA